MSSSLEDQNPRFKASAKARTAHPLQFLMALQVMRTPTALDLVGRQVESFGEHEFAALLADPRAFARAFGPLHPDRNGHEIEQLRRDAHELFATGGARLRLDNHRAAGLEAMTTKLIDAALAMAHADWTVLVSSSRELIVNDVGYARIEPRDRLPVPNGLVFPFRKDAVVIVAPPTSPTDGLVARAECEPEHADKLNLRIYGWAENLVYGASQNALQRVRTAARASPDRARSPSAHQRLPGPP